MTKGCSSTDRRKPFELAEARRAMRKIVGIAKVAVIAIVVLLAR